jgi:hypothetical protein
MSATNKHERSWHTDQATPLSRGVGPYSFAIIKRGEQGSILLFFLPWIWLLFLLLLGLFTVGMHSENALALEARLDICAVDRIATRRALYDFLVGTNKALQKTKLALYAIRSTKPIPVLGELGSMTEPALLAFANSLKAIQEAKISIGGIKEISKLQCEASPYSNLSAICAFQPITLTNFQREETLFADIPGRLSLSEGSLIDISCSGFFSKKIYISKMSMQGDSKLYEPGFTYAYQ